VRKPCCGEEEKGLPAYPPGSQEADEELARYAKAMGHPIRIRILRILAQQTECICGEMVALLPLAQSTVSQHLKVLKDAGLVQGEIDGPRVRYCIARGATKRLKTLISGL
jgi:ArsR family transcriptional regulator, arsenate/arsenite/antimonite-responsive transcriptional repressor